MDTISAVEIILGRLEDDGSRFSSSLILAEINQAQKKIAKETGCFESLFTVSSWSNANTFFTTNKAYKILRVYVGTDDILPLRSDEWADRESLDPGSWIKRGAALEIYPEPTEDVNIIARYLPADLSSGDDLSLPLELEDATLDLTTAVLMRREESTSAPYYEQQALVSMLRYDGDQGKVIFPWK